MAALLTNATTTTPGDAVSFSAPTTVIPEGVFAGAMATLQIRVPTKAWTALHYFIDSEPVNVEALGSYELRAVLSNVAPTTNISINATE